MSLKKYDVILADPPWWYNNRKTGGERKNKTKFGGGAQKHYKLMKAHDIAAMDVSSLCSENCALFLWMTKPLMYDTKRRKPNWKPTQKWKAPHDALTVLLGWDFEYCTSAFNWIKMTKDGSRPVYGPGYYTASNAEDCLIAKKGKVRPDEYMLPSVVMTPRGGHSEKPIEVHELIERMYPNANKLEMFARERRPGWDVFGNEVDEDVSYDEEYGFFFRKHEGFYKRYE